MNNLIFLAVAIPVLMLLVPNVYAGGPRNDSGSDPPGALECWSLATFAFIYSRTQVVTTALRGGLEFIETS